MLILKPGAPLLDVVKNESLLSIQMVIIPFLDYAYHSPEKAVIERLADYKLSLKKNLAHPHVECIYSPPDYKLHRDSREVQRVHAKWKDSGGTSEKCRCGT